MVISAFIALASLSWAAAVPAPRKAVPALATLAIALRPYHRDADFLRRFLTVTNQIRLAPEDENDLHESVRAARFLGWIAQSRGLDAAGQAIERLSRDNLANSNGDRSTLLTIAERLQVAPASAELQQFWDRLDPEISAAPLLHGRWGAGNERSLSRFERLIRTPYVLQLARPDRDLSRMGWDFHSFHNSPPIPTNIEKEVELTTALFDDIGHLLTINRPVSEAMPKPTVFYIGSGYDLVKALIGTDFSEMAALDLQSEVFSDFKSIIETEVRVANERNVLPLGQIENLDVRALETNRYQVLFRYAGRDRRAVYYRNRDMRDASKPLPTEVAQGYDVLYSYGSGFWGSPESLTHLVRPLRAGGLLVSSDYVQFGAAGWDTSIGRLRAVFGRLGGFEPILNEPMQKPFHIDILRRVSTIMNEPAAALAEFVYKTEIRLERGLVIGLREIGRFNEIVSVWLRG